ncbi:MAG: glycosyltransferase [Bacteroidetes bacterium]|nr:glycosyltransferase [Bacteroidota bacterium]
MNYWLLTSEYPPFFGGGISTYCYNTAMMLAENGHSISVFINDPAVSDFTAEPREGVRVIRFNPYRTKSSYFLGHTTNISYEFSQIVKLFIEKEGPPDIIEAQEYLGIAYYLLQYKHLMYDWCKDIPVVITMHSPSFLYMEYNQVPMYKYPNYWICEMERFCLQAASFIISPSKYMLDELRKRFLLTNENVEIIPNPFRSKRPVSLSSDTHNSEIIFYGKLTPQKGAFKLLYYFKHLWENGFTRPLTIIGGQDIVYQPEDLTMGDWIRKNFKKYTSKGYLKIEGRIKPSQIGDRIQQAEIVIVPSMNDNLPYVVFEMMALGKVLLVSKQGGHSEVIENNIDGFVFDHENPDTFYQQLKKTLSLTTEERKIIAANTLKKVNSQYSLEAIYQKKIKLLETILSEKSTTPKEFPFIRPSLRQEPANNIPIKKGLLSVVVPYYNMGKYADETLQSILQSDFPDKEIIIVNDGSNDELSLRKLEEYKNNAQVKIISGPNKGLAHTRNIGAENASGEFLAFLDADDTIEISYYSSAIRALNAYNNIDFVACWTQYFEGSDKIWPTFLPEPPIILYHNTVNSSALVYKRKSFLEYGKNDKQMAFQGWEDYESVVSILSKGGHGVVLPEVLFHYRVRTDSMIRSISVTKKLLLYQYISNKHKHFYATFASEIFNLLNANGPGILLDNPSLDYYLAEKLPFRGKISTKIISVIKQNSFMKAIAYKIYRLVKK